MPRFSIKSSPKSRKFLEDIKTAFEGIAQILTKRWIIEGVRAKNLETTLLFVDFSNAIDSKHWRKMEQILLARGLSNYNDALQNPKVMVRSPDRNTYFFNVDIGVLQRDKFAPYLVILCRDFVLRTSIYLIKEMVLPWKRLEADDIPQM